MFFAEFRFLAFLNLVTPCPGSKFQFDLAFDEHWVIGTWIQLFEVVAEGVIGELFNASDPDIEFGAAAEGEFRLIIQNRRGTQVFV